MTFSPTQSANVLVAGLSVQQSQRLTSPSPHTTNPRGTSDSRHPSLESPRSPLVGKHSCLSRSVTTLVTATSSTLHHHGLLLPRLALIPLVTGSKFDARAGVQGYEHRGSPDQPSPGLTC
ncbi:hypothetical protein CRG98_044951 [Punica granatum]|uniref:Uncharacterized protein n=1 Tax=Punica granatum TaxID=22663 RepID=A0A2I0HSF0_PUNGR|nr:hypothetical protein CRG98_044951 [Punica granatum]